MVTRKREVEARIKAEKLAKKEEKLQKKKNFGNRGVADCEEEAYELDEEQVEMMKEIKMHDPTIRAMGIDTLLYTHKHPMSFADEFEGLNDEWNTFEFEQKKAFRYYLHVLIDKPILGSPGSDEEGEEESKRQ
jgi:hypothetical protein